jgi:type IV pilus assembly protein PilC
MPTFKFVARDALGKVMNGSREARDLVELRRLLRTEELYLTKARQTSREDGPGGKSMLVAPVRPRDVVIAVRQMSTLVRAGVPLAEGLSALQLQIDKPGLKRALQDVQEGVVAGRTLNESMRDHPKVFNHLTVSLVEAGEGTGTLDKALEVAAAHLDREQDMRSRVKAGMVYPKIVVFAAAGTVALMLVLVVPTFKTIYTQFHAKLPGTTLALIAMSDFVMHLWWLLIAIIIGAVITIKEFKKTPRGARFFDAIMLKVPIVGPVLRKVAVARFTQTLAAGFRGGVPILGALTLAATTAGNAIVSEAAMAIVPKVRDGQPIASELERTNQFPPLVIQMIRSGEASGNLDLMLEEINRYYEEDIKYAIDKMTKMIEPIMTIVVGAIVLFVLLALYMPVFNLGNAINHK